MYISPHKLQGSPGLTRFSSAPGSLLSSVADSVLHGHAEADHHQLSSATHIPPQDPRFLAVAQATESPCPTSASESSCRSAETSSLLRHSSSPAGFFTNLLGPGKRLKTQWSFSRQDSLSQISEISIHELEDGISGAHSSDEAIGNVGQSYISSSIPIKSWDDANSIAFCTAPTKRTREDEGCILSNFSHLESQFSMPSTAIEIAASEKYFETQEDTIPCRVRAKRGFATHPRSIAERDRRIRISKGLKKLEEIIPNVDKQTNTSEMLDLAVKHIKELQSQIQKLNQDREDCTCSSK